MGRAALWYPKLWSHLQCGEWNRTENIKTAVIPLWWKAERWRNTLHWICSLDLHTCTLPDNLFQNVVRCSRRQCRFVKLIIRRCGCRRCPWPFVVSIHQVTLEAKQGERTSQFCWLMYDISSGDNHKTNCTLEQRRTLSPFPCFSINADQCGSEMILISVLPCRILWQHRLHWKLWENNLV